jgi:hypothetical protein
MNQDLLTVSVTVALTFLIHRVYSINTTITTPPEYWDVNDFPNPRYDVTKCSRSGKSSYVCDPNKLLSLSEGESV